MKRTFVHALVVIATCVQMHVVGADESIIDVASQEVLSIPALSSGEPGPDKRVIVHAPEYSGTNVFHTLFLPADWKKDGEKLPIIFEYTGNYSPPSGSTGEPEDAGLGYGLSGGKYIWVSLPYVSEDGNDNAVTWWGDTQATINYAKQNVPRIIRDFNANPNAVFLCGFSRGAIGASYLGLHDDEISSLWTAFVSHDHFDGVKPWQGDWGSPLEKYRREALVRLQRIGDRPYLVSQNGDNHNSEEYVRSVLPNVSNFMFGYVNTRDVLGDFPNAFAKSSHTDRWPLMPSEYRTKVWTWMNGIANPTIHEQKLGELIFEDKFQRNESQEEKDEPGNDWTTSSDKTAGGHKEVDLRDGTMYIYTHTTANHATSVRHEFAFTDGSIGLRFMLHNAGDNLKLNFADMQCKTVHAGHLFNATVTLNGLTFDDLKTGGMDLQTRERSKANTLTDEQRKMLFTKTHECSMPIEAGRWHELIVHVDGDKISADIDGTRVGSHRSEGYSHTTKSLLRLLVSQTATVDDIRIWRRK